MSEYTAEEIAEAHDPYLTDGDGARALVDINGNIVLQAAYLIDDEDSPVNKAWSIYSWRWDGAQWLESNGGVLWGHQTHAEAMMDCPFIGSFDFDDRNYLSVEIDLSVLDTCGVNEPYFDSSTFKTLRADERKGQKLPVEYPYWVSAIQNFNAKQ